MSAFKRAERLDFTCGSCSRRADFKVTYEEDRGGTRSIYCCRAHTPPEVRRIWRIEEAADGIGPIVQPYEFDYEVPQ